MGCNRRQLLSFSKALCVCQSRICSVSLFTVFCQRKIGNKKEREKEKTRKQTYQRQIRAKVDHIKDCLCDGLTGSEACRLPAL